MLTVEGFASLAQFYSAARNAISERMTARWVDIRTDWRSGLPENHDPDDKGPQRSPYFMHNLYCAAQYLVFDVLHRRLIKEGRHVQVLKTDGARVGIPLSLLQPVFPLYAIKGEYSHTRKLKRQEAKIREDERVFGTDTLKQDFWVDIFLNEQVFGEPSTLFPHVLTRMETAVSVVDWDIGCIACRQRNAILNATDHLLSGTLMLQQVGIQQLPAVLRHNILVDTSSLKNTMKMLQPLEGGSIVAPMEWLQDLRTPTVAGEQLATIDDAKGARPQELIVSLLSSSDPVNKQDVKERILNAFPSMSHRQFERHWGSVADQKPEIRRPGRKSPHRIDTVS